jgi:hydrogenase expression/formation protein HypC
MCVAVPAKVLAIEGQEAEVELSGVRRRVSVVLTPEVQVGQYVLLHTGFAIGVLDEQEAQETLAMFDQIAAGADVAARATPHDPRL